MKIKRFKYLKEKGVSDDIMFDVVKYFVIPSLNISFDEVVMYTILLIPYRKQLHHPLWELYLNVLIKEYKISLNAVEEAVKKGICERKEEVQKYFEEFMENITK